jgi:ribosomal protein S18 acetylase RimI-like enzyme
MNTILEDLSDASLVQAIEGNLFAFFPLLDAWPSAEVHETPELMWSITDIPFPLFNSVLRARLTPGKVDEHISAAIDRCKSREVPMLWRTGPSTKPSDLGSLLLQRGFHESDVPGMAANLNSLSDDVELPEKVVIREVDTDEELQDWCQILCTAFEMPGFVADAFFGLSKALDNQSQLSYRNYIGYLENEPVATSSVLLAAGVAGIYNVSTIQEARRKGIGSAITAIPLLKARSLGYRAGILHSTASGFNVYRKLGFREYCKLFHYVWTND